MFESIADPNPLDGAPGVPLAGDTMRRRAILITFIVALAAIFPGRAAVGADATPDIPDIVPPLTGYELVWSDEFDGTELDMTKWSYRHLGPRGTNGALNTKESVSLDGKGHLVLTTSRAAWRSGDKFGEFVDGQGNLVVTSDKTHGAGAGPWRSDLAGNYRTPMICTQGKYEPTFGYIEIRAKMPKQLGHWCAFWLQSPTYGKIIGDPATSGCEIDIMEYRRSLPDKIVHNYHWDGYGKKHKCKGSGKRPAPGLSEGWHTFGLLWTERQYIFYVDRKISWRSYPAISKRSQYIILSQEIGKWAGDITKATLPDGMIVDYVRVYQKTKTAEREDRGQRPVQVKGGVRLTTTSGTAGVSGKIQGDNTSAFGGTAWPVKNSGRVEKYSRKGYVRFDISGIKKPITNAAFQLTVESISADYLDVRVYAITDESLDRWDPGATKWKNAPANNTASPSAADLSKSIEVGSIRLDNGDKAYPPGTVVTLSNQALKKVINKDTNGLVTFILGEANAADANLLFAGDKHATYAPPTLVYDFDVGQ